MDPGTNPFETLRVALDADDASVRKAYARLLREARAQGDAAATGRIQDAFETIRDAEPRERARRALADGDKIAIPLAQARALLERGQYGLARNVLRQALQTTPGSEPLLCHLVEAERHLGRLDAATITAGRLIKTAPGNAHYWILRAQLLAQHAETLNAPDKARDELRLSLRHVRKAKELGEQSARTQVFESELLRALGSELAASKVLKDRLHEAQELRSEELEIALSLLRQHAAHSQGRAFQGALESIATALPVEEERKRTIAHALCRLGGELLPERPDAGARCIELAEICSPSDPVVEEMVQLCASHREALECRVEAVAVAVANQRAAQVTASLKDSSWLTWSWSGWKTWVCTFIVIKAAVFGWRSCRHEPPQPDDRFLRDEKGNVTHVIDERGRRISLKDIEAQANAEAKQEKKPKRTTRPRPSE